ncbi:MAG: hypothetical protein IOD12_11015 [Silvanigrellales bacterium]|nr:hypothetical protein [Silvanigrellales bacterium]
MKMNSVSLTAVCFAPAMLLLVGCGRSDEGPHVGANAGSKADSAVYRGGAPAPMQGSYSQTWQGQTACLQLVETLMPQQQQQGNKGKQVTMSVCQAIVTVKCEGAKTDSALERTQWTPKQCLATVQGTLVSSQMAQEPQAFQWSQSYDVTGTAQQLQIPIGPGTFFVAGSLRAPTQWDAAPQLQLGLSKQGSLAPVSFTAVSFALQGR